MQDEPLVLIDRTDQVATITINRPEALNALGREGDGLAFLNACAELNADTSLRAIILTGSGRAFSAGGDLKAMRERSGAFAADGMAIREGYRRNIHQLVRALFQLELPVLTAVNGAAIGLGCDVACLGDIRIASTKAIFGSTFLKIGLIPGDGGAWLLPRIVGMSRAAELLFTAKVIKADEACDWGLVSEVVEPDLLMERAREIAAGICAQPPHALRLTKSLLRSGQNASFDTIMEMSAAMQAISHLTDDHMEGVVAMLEKRQPEFKGQ